MFGRFSVLAHFLFTEKHRISVHLNVNNVLWVGEIWLLLVEIRFINISTAKWEKNHVKNTLVGLISNYTQFSEAVTTG